MVSFVGDSFTILLAVVIVVVVILAAAIKIVPEYQRGVIFRLGRLLGAKGPGIFFIIPLIDKMYRVDLRTAVLDVPVQEVITRDNVPVRVNAVVYFRVMEPTNAVVQIVNYRTGTSQISQTTLRSIIGQSQLDELLSNREAINKELQKVIDDATDPWGIKVSAVEIKDVEIPKSMQRALAAQAEAERERRAKIINAQGEFQAAEKLADAAKIMAKHPITLQLRTLQTIQQVATENASTIVLPFPMEMLRVLDKLGGGKEE